MIRLPHRWRPAGVSVDRTIVEGVVVRLDVFAATAAWRYINDYEALNEWQRAALIDFAYNLGSSALEGSTMRRKFNAGDIAGG